MTLQSSTVLWFVPVSKEFGTITTRVNRFDKSIIRFGGTPTSEDTKDSWKISLQGGYDLINTLTGKLLTRISTESIFHALLLSTSLGIIRVPGSQLLKVAETNTTRLRALGG